MPRYVIGLGSCDPLARIYIQRAVSQMGSTNAIRIVGVSKYYDNPAVGGQTQFRFVNAAVAVVSHLHPNALWWHLLSIEIRLGRVRLIKDGPRTIDLDILWRCDGAFKSRYVELPHPRLFERPFALLPAQQAAINAQWPLKGLTKTYGRRDVLQASDRTR